MANGEVGPGPWFVPRRDSLASCFGCGAGNESGLRMQFRELGGGVVESIVEVHPEFCGVDLVVHGGIQTTILDEVMGVAAQLSLDSEAGAAPCVTAEIAVQFKRPVPVGAVTARALVERVEGRDLYISGAILGPEGSELTTATSRWRQLRV